jgi:hypothetical protein
MPSALALRALAAGERLNDQYFTALVARFSA